MRRDERSGEWMQRMRNAFMAAVDETAMRDIAMELVDKAKRGDRWAIQMIFSMSMPPEPVAPVAPVHVAIASKKKPIVINGTNGAHQELEHQNET